jgi:diguanylate cyclase (GGDEF)-like protein
MLITPDTPEPREPAPAQPDNEYVDLIDEEAELTHRFPVTSSIGIKLGLLILVAAIVLGTVANVLITQRLKSTYRSAARAHLAGVAESWQQTFELSSLVDPYNRLQRRIDAVRKNDPALSQVTISWRAPNGKDDYVQSGRSGSGLVATRRVTQVPAGQVSPFAEGPKSFTEVQGQGGSDFAALSEPVIRGGETRAMITLHYSLAALSSALTRTKLLVIGTTAVAAILLWLLALLIVDNTLLKPLNRLRAATHRLGDGDRGHRLNWTRKDEIGLLATDFDKMADKLDAAHDHLETLALTDPLTGLLNHRAFNERLEQELRRAERSRGQLAVVALDVDNFREVNDRFGHGVGDVGLRQLAGILRQHLRPGDICGRVGGDEFCLGLVGAGSEEAENVVERLRHQILQSDAGPSQTRFTISAGIAEFPTHALGRDELLQFADGAMYWAKTSGRNRTCIYTSDSAFALSPQEQASRAAAQGLINTVHALASAVDAKDGYTSMHSQRVGLYSAALAAKMGFNEDEVEVIRTAGVLHDVGKIGISDHVLQKPGKLTDDEWEIMRSHSKLGRDIISGAGMDEIADLVLHLHERFDGNGYPDRLAGEQIPLASRVLHVADMLEAMTSSRVYRKRMTTQAALTELERVRGTQVDPRVADALIAMVRSGEVLVDDEPLDADSGDGSSEHSPARL